MNLTVEAPQPRGSLMILGGCERFNNREIWQEFVRLAGGKGAKIAVFPTASRKPLRDGDDVVVHLNRLGAEAFLVPLAPTGLDEDWREVSKSEKLITRVAEAQGVFFVGGDQSRIIQTLTEDREPTLLLNAVWHVYREGGVVAGTSAGAAIMSRIMYRSADSVLATLLNGVKLGKETDHGLGFLHEEWFVDQHCLTRGRFARAIAAMREHNFRYGVGIDEDTALVVTEGTVARVVGYRGVLVIDLSESQADAGVPEFNLKNAKLSFLGTGDLLNLKTREMTASEEKQNDRKVDPQDVDFRPAFRRKPFTNDILGNTTLLDMLSKLIDNQHDEAVGLAFDGSAARQGPTRGFEFRFYREADSVGWETDSSGAYDYTILNIHLDIRPIQIRGPLYD